jgi:Na+-transporting NADH:ubiquinone oxidoreductase subunit B
MMMSLPFYWHLVIVGFAFGAVFAGDRSCLSCLANKAAGLMVFLIGFAVVLIRVISPASPEEHHAVAILFT